MKRIRLIYSFFANTLDTNSAIALALAAFSINEPPHVLINMIAISLVLFGTPLTFLIKHLGRRSEYYFYYNNNISKMQLGIGCQLFYLAVGFMMWQLGKHV